MKYILFEDQAHFSLLPLTFTRPVYDLRIGIYTFRERWHHFFKSDLLSSAYGYLHTQPLSIEEEAFSVWINGRICPNQELLRLAEEVVEGKYYVNTAGDLLMAGCNYLQAERLTAQIVDTMMLESLELEKVVVDIPVISVAQLTDLFTQIKEFIIYDIERVIQNEQTEQIKDPFTMIYGKDNIFVAPGAKVEAAIIHAEDGPVYIGSEAHIQLGAMVYGTHSIGKGSVVAMGSRLRGNTCVGPGAKVGGEIKNSYIGPYSNKGHEGYLGNSVLGVNCNLGADSNVSNMKNTLGNVKQWSYVEEKLVDTGMTFCGTVMGDYSRCGINSMLNTGTVVGVSAQVYGSGFPPKFIPSFAWGGKEGFETYRLEESIRSLDKLFGIKGTKWSEQEKGILRKVFGITRKYRKWEN